MITILPEPESGINFNVDSSVKLQMKENIQELLKIVSNKFQESINSFKSKKNKIFFVETNLIQIMNRQI
jgi:citrate lyase gamma subunit